MSKIKVYKLIFIILLLIALFYPLINENGILKYIKLKNEIKKLQQEINKAEQKLYSLQIEIDSLKNSKEKIEKVAREKYHMIKPKEKVIIIEEY